MQWVGNGLNLTYLRCAHASEQLGPLRFRVRRFGYLRMCRFSPGRQASWRPTIPEDAAHSKIEGIALTGSGILFLSKALLDLKIGAPPANGTELIAWQSAHKIPLSLLNEVSFIATVLLVLGAIGLFLSLDRPGHRLARWGCSLLAVTIPVMMALTVIHGRLVYPVHSIALNETATLRLLVSLYYGGQHTVGLLFGIATILIALSMRTTFYGNTLVWTGVLTGVADVVGSYPWVIGLTITVVCEVAFAAWFIATGIKLTRSGVTQRHSQIASPVEKIF